VAKLKIVYIDKHGAPYIAEWRPENSLDMDEKVFKFWVDGELDYDDMLKIRKIIFACTTLCNIRTLPTYQEKK
jgi:saccharopine dehydrogenase-like NADP-dependent oxidoreductase